LTATLILNITASVACSLTRQARALELDSGIDMSKYVGGAIVVFDLRLRRVKWQQHLDLSTDSTDYRAYIYSAPVLADLDRDGKLEIIVGTSAVRPSDAPLTRIAGTIVPGGRPTAGRDTAALHPDFLALSPSSVQRTV
jgi:hypothetical protein